MIKAGQIYQRSSGVILLITESEPRTESIDLLHTKINDMYSYITSSGRTGSIHKSIFSCLTLIAEYATWQEAANSKEFNATGIPEAQDEI